MREIERESVRGGRMRERVQEIEGERGREDERKSE